MTNLYYRPEREEEEEEDRAHDVQIKYFLSKAMKVKRCFIIVDPGIRDIRLVCSISSEDLPFILSLASLLSLSLIHI